MNSSKKALLSASATRRFGSFFIRDFQSQRRKIATLARKTAALRNRGNELLAVSNSLAKKIGQSSADFAAAVHLTENTIAGLQLPGLGREPSISLDSKIADERRLTDSPDMVEALQDAAEILKTEFGDTEGSGRDTLVKCENVLKRAQTVCTIELPLY